MRRFKVANFKFLIALLLLLSNTLGLGQLRGYYFENCSGKNTSYKKKGEAFVGDTLQDFFLGPVINEIKGKSKLSDFKDKLIILDFWSTSCLTCLQLFPHLERLQKQYGEKIQIILVNPIESEYEIREKWKLPYMKSFAFPNLLCMVQAKTLGSLFSIKNLPHQVWIDSNLVVKLRTHPMGTYPKKIDDYFRGNELFDLNDNNSSAAYEPGTPYYKYVGELNGMEVIHGSFFTSHNNKYSSISGGRTENKVDSLEKTIRNTYVNIDLFDFCRVMFKRELDANTRDLIFCPYYYDWRWLPFFKLSVKDTLDFTYHYTFLNQPFERWIDTDFVKSNICYEQVMPIDLTYEERLNYTRKDFEKYLNRSRHAYIGIVQIKTPCYCLIRSSKLNKLTPQSKGMIPEGGYKKFVQGGKKMIQTYTIPLKSAISDCVSQLILPADKNGIKFLVDDTRLAGNVDIALPQPGEIKSIEELRPYLNLYDLDIIKSEKTFNYIEIKD